ncbi:hypothetical protein D0T56_11230 [Dysgonomonas sp. 520]|nr:hypothetical protein [Dysgonomonas sp. 520]
MLFACKQEQEPERGTNRQETKEEKKYTRFKGNYNNTFNDLHNLHTEAALRKGIPPLACRADTSKYMTRLKRIPNELFLYKTDSLAYSIPYLTNDASDLLINICANFRDSLSRKSLTLYKPIITSITRTDEDVAKLTRRNVNASDSSAHRYATTFDISWRRFEKVDTRGADVGTDKLKLILGEVLHDLRERDRCYIKHERKQACFHITVR